MRILFDARWIGRHGIGRFASELLARLPAERLGGLPLLHPVEPVWLPSVLALRRPDVYFSPGYNAPRWSPVPFVFTIHDLIHVHFGDERRAVKRAYYRLLVRPAARKAKRVLTGSEFTKRELIEWAGVSDKHVVVVGHGVSAAFTPHGARYDPGYPYVLYLGYRKPHKNVPRLLEAFARAGIPDDVRLMLSGEPDETTRTLAARLRIDQRVVFAGRIPEVDLPAYYRGALAVTLPSLYEGFGLPTVEAMASGTPVLAARAGALPEVVGDAAALVDPYDVDSIAGALREILEDDELRTTLRHRGLERAKTFSWDVTASRVRSVLEQASAR